MPGALRRLVAKELGSVSVTTPVGGVSIARRTAITDPLPAIHALLEIPAQIAEKHGHRVVVVLDEIQALMKLEGLDGVFRSHIQHHRNVSYLFSGSEPSLLRALFEDQARPLYGQAERRRLGRLAFDAAHDFIGRRFSQTGKDAGDAVTETVYVTEGHPQRLMLLANLLWERTQPDAPATVADVRASYDAALRMVDPELRFLWESLTANEQRVLAALAAGFTPYQQKAKLLLGLANRSSAARAVNGLESRAIIERTDDDVLADHRPVPEHLGPSAGRDPPTVLRPSPQQRLDHYRRAVAGVSPVDAPVSRCGPSRGRDPGWRRPRSRPDDLRHRRSE